MLDLPLDSVLPIVSSPRVRMLGGVHVHFPRVGHEFSRVTCCAEGMGSGQDESDTCGTRDTMSVWFIFSRVWALRKESLLRESRVVDQERE